MFRVVLFTGFLLLGGSAIRDSLFQAVSALTTTGFSTVEMSSLDDHSIFFILIFILILMIIGAGYGSSGGAIKLVRVLIVIIAIRWYVKKLTVPPHTVVPLKMGGRTLTQEDVLVTLLHVVLYYTLLLGGTLLFVLMGHTVFHSFFEVASAQGNVGLSVIPSYTDLEKVILILFMWIGRMEIIPFRVLITGWRK